MDVLGGCYQQHTTANQGIRVYVNTTKLKGYAPFDPTPVDPFEHVNYPGYPSCETGYGYPCGDGINGNPYCGIATADEISCGAGTTNYFPQGQLLNCYKLTTATSSVSDQCVPQYGFKNVAAKKIWHGRIGYTSTDIETPDYNGDFDTVQFACDWVSGKMAPDTTHYLNLTVHGYAHFYDSFGNDEWGSSDQTVEVNRWSGKKTVSNCHELSSSLGYSMWQLARDSAAVGQLNKSYIGQKMFSNSFPQGYYYTDFWGTVGSTYTRTGQNSWQWVTPDGLTTIDYDLDGSLHYYHNSIGTDPSYPWAGSTIDITYTFTATNYTYVNHTYISTIASNSHLEESAYGILSNPYTADMLYNDIQGLLLQVPLNDDKMYPLRTDENITYAPLVTWNEAYNYPSLESCDPPYVGDTTISEQILGTFMPAGYTGYYNFKHPNYRQSTPVCAMAWYIHGWGQITPDFLPQNCTQWTNNYDALAGVDSAFNKAFLYYDKDSHTLSARKYMESIIKMPAFNWGSPCGPNRFQADSSSMYCIASSAAKVLNLDTGNPPNELGTGDYCRVLDIWTPANDGIWSIIRTGDYTITLDTLIVSGSQVPSDILDLSAQGPFIHRLRWKNAPAICGRDVIYAIDVKTPITCSVLSQSYLVNGDIVRISDNTLTSPLNGSWVVDLVSSQSFALRGTTSASAAGTWKPIPKQPTHVYTLFGPHYRWNTDAPEHVYIYKEWTHDARDYQENDRLWNQYDNINFSDATYGTACGYNPVPAARPRATQSVWGMPRSVKTVTCVNKSYTWDACRPTAIYTTPNGDGNGNLNSFPAVFHADDKYGAAWEASAEPWMTNPLWQAPPCPCTSDGFANYGCYLFFWLEADTPESTICIGDIPGDTQYYPHRPYVEARCTAPPGAPPLDSFASYLGCLSIAKLNVSEVSQPKGNVCTGATALKPWAIFKAELACVCANGRWASVYDANGVHCSYYLEEPI